MAGTWIEISAVDGGSFRAYVATPEAGSGPGILLLQEIFGVNANIRKLADYYAEEGYVVVAPDMFWRMEPDVELGHDEAGFQKALDLYGRFDEVRAIDDMVSSVEALRALPACKGCVGALGFCLGGKLVHLAAAKIDIDCGVSYYGVGIEQALDHAPSIKCPVVYHFASGDEYVPMAAVEQVQAAFVGRDEIEIFVYLDVGHAFANTTRDTYNKPATMMAHSRSIALFRRNMGPHFNLSELWDKHCEYEFATRNVNDTMATMVPEPYVNHIPTMTGGVGYACLKQFYANHFIHSNPDDTKLIPISRTIGADRVVDEILFCFTHNSEIDWMLPGIAPTGKYVEIPLIAIVCFRGGKLYNEHIYWDQASVLVQVGVLDPTNLPVAGIETAKKLVDETLPSNTLMANWAGEAVPDGGEA